MKVLKAAGNCGGIESGLISSEGLNISEVSEEFSSVDEFEHQIEIFGVLGKTFESDDEGVVDLGMDKVFVVDVVNLLGFHDLVFIQ